MLRPDTYIGSVEHDRQQLWVFDNSTQKFDFKWIHFVPGLYKIFGKSNNISFEPGLSFFLLADEILVNAADNFQRDKNMTQINVEINQEENLISVWNNGKGIPIDIHKEHNCYVPEMIFGK